MKHKSKTLQQQAKENNNKSLYIWCQGVWRTKGRNVKKYQGGLVSLKCFSFWMSWIPWGIWDAEVNHSTLRNLKRDEIFDFIILCQLTCNTLMLLCSYIKYHDCYVTPPPHPPPLPFCPSLSSVPTRFCCYCPIPSSLFICCRYWYCCAPPPPFFFFSFFFFSFLLLWVSACSFSYIFLSLI